MPPKANKKPSKAQHSQSPSPPPTTPATTAPQPPAASQPDEFPRHIMQAITLPGQFRADQDELESTEAFRRYREQREAGTLPVRIPRRTAAETEALLARFLREDGEFVSTGEIAAGLGRFMYAQREVDGPWALELGFDSPAQVELARSQGILARGFGEDAGPQTLWFPFFIFFNPEKQPEGEGRWEFHLDGDRNLAHINVGGQMGTGWDLTNTAHPSAADVFRVRRAYIDNAGPDDLDATDGIDIVWIPATAEPDAADVGTVGEGLGQIDGNSGLPHDPTNGGEHDQTGNRQTARYHTHEFKGTNFTLDRSRAYPNVPEPHKSWIVNQNGKWQQCRKYKALDWSDASLVEAMNKWKEQTLGRATWDKKRQQKREAYTRKQEQWLMDLIKQSNGEVAGGKAMAKIAADFNKRFADQTRDVTGLTGKYGRLRTVFAEHGDLKPDDEGRKPHTLAKKVEPESGGKTGKKGGSKSSSSKKRTRPVSESEEEPQESEQDDEEPAPPPKRRRSQRKRRDEESDDDFVT